MIFLLQLNRKTFNPDILYICDCWHDENECSAWHAHDFVEISIVLEGESYYTIGDQTLIASAGTVMLFNPEVYHKDEQKSSTSSHQLHIGIRDFALEGYQRNYFPFDSPVIRFKEGKDRFLNKCWQLIEENNRRQYSYEVMLKAIIMEMIVEILRSDNARQIAPARLKSKETEKEKQEIVNNIIYFLEKHHSEDISLETISDRMYISPTYISKVFKEETGESPINYLIKLRLQRAKDLLESQQITVKEAAQLVGYQDAYHFSKLFKKHYGKSPSEFLRSG